MTIPDIQLDQTQSPSALQPKQGPTDLQPTAKPKFADAKKVAAGPLIPTDQGISVDRNRRDFGKLETIKAEHQAFARMVRKMDHQMEKLGHHLEKMKARISDIIKQYPPFPPGSEERIQRLKSINSIRKQIDELSFTVNLELKVLFQADNEKSEARVAEIDPPQSPSGSQYLQVRLMDIDDNATDTDLDTAFEQLAQKQQAIIQKREELSKHYQYNIRDL